MGRRIYIYKLRRLGSCINDRMEDMSNELFAMNAYIAELDDGKERNFDTAEWDCEQKLEKCEINSRK